MPLIQHPVFGALEAGPADETGVVWEGYPELDPNEDPVPVALWSSREARFDPAELDRFADFLARLPFHDAMIRAQLTEALEDDLGAYLRLIGIDFHGTSAVLAAAPTSPPFPARIKLEYDTTTDPDGWVAFVTCSLDGTMQGFLVD